MTTEDAFKEGIRLVREAMGLPKGDLDIKGTDVPVLAAYNVFVKRVKGVESHPDFEKQGPEFAKRLIIAAYATKS